MIPLGGFMKALSIALIFYALFYGAQAFADFKQCEARSKSADFKFQINESGQLQMLPKYLKDEIQLNTSPTGSQLIFANADGTFTKLISTMDKESKKLSQLKIFKGVDRNGKNEKSQTDQYFTWNGDDCFLSRITQTNMIDKKDQFLVVLDKNLCTFVRQIAKSFRPAEPKIGSKYYAKLDAVAKQFNDSIRGEKYKLGLIGGSDPYTGTSADSVLISSLPGICDMFYSYLDNSAIIPQVSTPKEKARSTDGKKY